MCLERTADRLLDDEELVGRVYFARRAPLAMIARPLSQTRDALTFKSIKTEERRPVSLPVSAIAALDEHRKVQDEFRRQFGPEYRADLDLIFANPDGSPFKPDSISPAETVVGLDAKGNSRKPSRVFRHDKAIKLRNEGKSWRNIAQTLGMPISTAIDACRECPDNSPKARKR
jgi:hypothetical protein